MKTLTILFYPTFLLMVFIATLIFIPKKQYKEYFIYGFLVGGLGDILVVGLLQNILHVMWFKNQGIFNVYGMIALSPPSWTVTAMIFLYFLPRRRMFLYPYIATWASSSVAYAFLVHNAGLYDFVPWLYPIIAYLLFLGWWSFCAWLFMTTSPLARPDGVPARKIFKDAKKIRLRKPIKIK